MTAASFIHPRFDKPDIQVSYNRANARMVGSEGRGCLPYPPTALYSAILSQRIPGSVSKFSTGSLAAPEASDYYGAGQKMPVFEAAGMQGWEVSLPRDTSGNPTVTPWGDDEWADPDYLG